MYLYALRVSMLHWRFRLDVMYTLGFPELGIYERGTNTSRYLPTEVKSTKLDEPQTIEQGVDCAVKQPRAY